MDALLHLKPRAAADYGEPHGQFLPAWRSARLAGYAAPAKPIMTITGIASLAVACFGGMSIVLAAITASLCTGTDPHADPAKRYIAASATVLFYLIGGLCRRDRDLVYRIPKALIAILAGLALIGAIGSNLAAAMEDTNHREAAVITFLATASGMTLGLGRGFLGRGNRELGGMAARPKHNPRFQTATHMETEGRP